MLCFPYFSSLLFLAPRLFHTILSGVPGIARSLCRVLGSRRPALPPALTDRLFSAWVSLCSEFCVVECFPPGTFSVSASILPPAFERVSSCLFCTLTFVRKFSAFISSSSSLLNLPRRHLLKFNILTDRNNIVRLSLIQAACGTAAELSQENLVTDIMGPCRKSLTASKVVGTHAAPFSHSAFHVILLFLQLCPVSSASS